MELLGYLRVLHIAPLLATTIMCSDRRSKILQKPITIIVIVDPPSNFSQLFKKKKSFDNPSPPALLAVWMWVFVCRHFAQENKVQLSFYSFCYQICFSLLRCMANYSYFPICYDVLHLHMRFSRSTVLKVSI